MLVAILSLLSLGAEGIMDIFQGLSRTQCAQLTSDQCMRLNVDFRCSFCLYCRHHTTGENWININPVHNDDYGEYVCIAKNELGVAEGVVVLEPLGYCFDCSAIRPYLLIRY